MHKYRWPYMHKYKRPKRVICRSRPNGKRVREEESTPLLFTAALFTADLFTATLFTAAADALLG